MLLRLIAQRYFKPEILAESSRPKERRRMPDWRDLEEFPKYAVNELGEFVNMKSDRDIIPSLNQQGLCKVSLINDGRQYTRSVAVLVANTFLGEQRQEHFDTPIHLDGDRANCRVDNLMWRPRWFAVKYHRQFQWDEFWMNTLQVYDLATNETFAQPKDAATKYGLLYSEIIASPYNKTPCVPTFQYFGIVSNHQSL